MNWFLGHDPRSGLHGLGSEAPFLQAGVVLATSEETMDDLKKKRTADRSKINMHEPWEVDHWTKELDVFKA